MIIEKKEFTAATLELAEEAAVQFYGVPVEQLDVTVISEGSKGFLGIGKADAIAAVSMKDTRENRAKLFLKGVTERMGLDAKVTVSEDEEQLKVTLEGEDMGMLIGHHGDTLDAIQYLTSLAVNRGSDEYRRVLVDTEGYREKREETLRRLAERSAARAVKIGRVAMEPMNPYERRILHTALQGNPRVTTYSEGTEPYRRVVIVRK